MKLSEYQDFTPSTNLVPTLDHVFAGLMAEAGEVAGVYQKYARKDFDETEKMSRLVKEIGGLMWYLSELANLEGIDLEAVLEINKDILLSRQKRVALQGDGDNR